MEDTANLKIPYIMAAQAQKHVTHNEALRTLDVLVQLSVIDRDLTTPPSSPDDGDRYLVAASAMGDWAGRDNEIAAWQDGGWAYHVPNVGWILWVRDENKLLVWDGSGWDLVTTGGGGGSQSELLFGVNSTADNVNRLTAKSDAVLFSHDDVTPGTGDMRLNLNKAQSADTSAILLQDNYSGRAEIGLVGDDDLRIKASSDGSTWNEAIVVDAGTGNVEFPNSKIAHNSLTNVLGDCGRFHTNTTAITAGPFVLPAYMRTFNNSSFSNHGKFIQNNTDFGGTAGLLNNDVKELIQKIKNPTRLRYGSEFYVARLTMGTGIGIPVNFGGANYYLSLFPYNVQRFVSATVHFYLKSTSGSVLVVSNDQRIYVDGVLQASHAVLGPSDGWKSIRIEDEIAPYDSFGYSPEHFRIHQSNSGAQALIACMAVVPGIVNIDPNVGAIMNANGWPA